MEHVSDTIFHVGILFAVGMIFVPTLSPLFICFYTLSGLYILLERLFTKTFNMRTDERIRMDCIANFIFTLIILVKLLKYILLYIPEWDYAMIIAVGFLKTIAGFVSMVKFHERVSFHTVLSRITGIIMYLFPYMILLLEVQISCGILCGLACLAGIEELTCTIVMKKNNPNIRSVFSLLKH